MLFWNKFRFSLTAHPHHLRQQQQLEILEDQEEVHQVVVIQVREEQQHNQHNLEIRNLWIWYWCGRIMEVEAEWKQVHCQELDQDRWTTCFWCFS
jgi:hypothetical protein